MAALPGTGRPVSYAARLEPRDPAGIDLVVIHCTELPDLATARDYAERVHYPESRTGNCGHHYVDRDGAVEHWVPHARIAHHVRGYNARSIGIELVNRGRWPDWLSSTARMDEAYPDAQMAALAGLLAGLCEALPGLAHIAGHEDLDREWVPASDDAGVRVPRKLDPGPLFHWDWLLARTRLVRLAPPGQSA